MRPYPVILNECLLAGLLTDDVKMRAGDLPHERQKQGQKHGGRAQHAPTYVKGKADTASRVPTTTFVWILRFEHYAAGQADSSLRSQGSRGRSE
jgi:hypothetical protein